MFIDIHIHTTRHSTCSVLNPERLVDRALEIGLNGIVITEHNYLWSGDEITNLQARVPREKLLILRGQELDTQAGHVLVYGYPERLPPDMLLADLKKMVHEVSGALVVAHPFRWGTLDNMSFDVQAHLLKKFDAIEVFNGNCTFDEALRVQDVAKRMGINTVGGSDAHSLDMLGRYSTRFYEKIENEIDLARAILAGKCAPASYESGTLPLTSAENVRKLNQMSFKAIFFDLYGTLVDIDTKEDLEAFNKTALWLSLTGIRIDGYEFMERYLRTSRELHAAASAHTQNPEIDVSEVFKTVLEDRVPLSGVNALLPQLCLVFRAMPTRYIRTYPWVHNVLARLKKLGYKLGLLSNAQRSFSLAEMEMLGIRSYFDALVFSSDVGVQKPDRPVFERILTQLSLSPDEVVFIGNDLKADISGAKALGMSTVLLRSNIASNPFSIKPDITIYEHEMERLPLLLAHIGSESEASSQTSQSYHATSQLG